MMEGISTVITPGTAAACILAIIIGYVYTKEERRAMQGLAVSQAAQEQSPLDLGDLSRAEALAKVIPDYESTKNDLTRIEYPERPLHVVLIATGSVASVKIPLMVKDLLQHRNALVQVIASKASLRFFDREQLQRENLGVNVWTDESDWKYFQRVGDPILHIELRRWADLVCVAPCSANTIARIRSGAADSLASAFMLALNRRRTSVWLFPAMNTQMWEHPIVQENLTHIKGVLRYSVFDPIQKGLACGDDGIGAMMEWRDIINKVAVEYQLDS